MLDLYADNYKTPIKEKNQGGSRQMERYTNAHELKESILLRGQFFPNDPQSQHNHKQNANRIL